MQTHNTSRGGDAIPVRVRIRVGDGSLRLTAVGYAEWVAAGFVSSAEIGEWCMRGMTPAVAAGYRSAGFLPGVAEHWAEFIDDAEVAAEWAAAGIRPGQAAGWLAVDRPSPNALLYYLAGITPEEVAGFEARRVAGEDLGPALRMLAALRAPHPA